MKYVCIYESVGSSSRSIIVRSKQFALKTLVDIVTLQWTKKVQHDPFLRWSLSTLSTNTQKPPVMYGNKQTSCLPHGA